MVIANSRFRDGYKEDVISIVYDSFGVVRERLGVGNQAAFMLDADTTNNGGIEFATFFVEGSLFALEAAYVMEALGASDISPVSMGGRTDRVGILAIQNESEKAYAWVFDLGYLLSGVPSLRDSSSQVVVVKHGKHNIGLLVGALHSVAEFNENDIISTPIAADSNGRLIKQIIKANNGKILIQGIDIDYLTNMLTNPFAQVEFAKQQEMANEALQDKPLERERQVA